jgi:hypothetical protein
LSATATAPLSTAAMATTADSPETATIGLSIIPEPLQTACLIS